MRKIVQIAYGESGVFNCMTSDTEQSSGLFGLCNDGTLWKLINFNLSNRKGPEWVKVVDIPQDDFLGIKEDQYSQLKYVSIGELELTVRAYNALCKAGKSDLYQLIQTHTDMLSRIDNLGKVSQIEVLVSLFDFLIKSYLFIEIKNMPIFRGNLGRKILKNKEEK